MHHAPHPTKPAAHPPAVAEALAELGNQHRRLAARVRELASINCGTANPPGVARVADRVQPWLASLADAVTAVPLPTHPTVRDDGTVGQVAVADALVAVRRPHAPRRVLLNIHLDTVYGPEHPFQTVAQPEPNLLRGPGVADAKGGLVVMLAALEA
ncbi:MAG: M20/M25/M40 family metallo-hydrolase, partial [Planctomycetota bacterium]